MLWSVEGKTLRVEARVICPKECTFVIVTSLEIITVHTC